MNEAMSAVAIASAIACVVVFTRLFRAGYYAAILPVLSAVMYVFLELEWVGGGAAEKIGDLRNLAWSVIEIGLMGGSALVFFMMGKDIGSIGETIHREINEEVQENDS